MASRLHRSASSRSPAAAPWRWATAGALIGLLATTVLQAPARWLAAALSEATGGKIGLLETRGSVWEGSSRLLLSGGAGSNDHSILPQRVNWSIRPSMDGLVIRFSADCCTPSPLSIAITPGWGRVRLSVRDAGASAQAQPSVWPAAMLAGLGTPWNTLQIDGQLGLRTQGLSVEWAQGRLSVAGRAELLASDLSSRLSTLKPMGSYRFTLVGGTTPTLEVTTVEGSLQLAGSGRWVGSRLHFDGTASASPEREAALSNLLNIIGRRNGPRSIIKVG